MRRIAIAGILLAGCTSISPAGPDTHFAAKSGSVFQSSSGLQGDLLAKASAHCARQGKQMMPVHIYGQTDARNIPSANLAFRCLSDRDPELARPGWTPDPQIKIQVTR